MADMKVFAPQAIPDPIAYKSGFRRKLEAGEHMVPNDLDFRRLLLKGHLEPMDELSAQAAGRPIKQKPKEAKPIKKED